eukprot:4027485-Prymnesium_polylepis.1
MTAAAVPTSTPWGASRAGSLSAAKKSQVDALRAMTGAEYDTCLRALDACNGDSNRAAEALLLEPERFGASSEEAYRAQGAENDEEAALRAATEASMAEAAERERQLDTLEAEEAEAFLAAQHDSLLELQRQQAEDEYARRLLEMEEEEAEDDAEAEYRLKAEHKMEVLMEAFGGTHDEARAALNLCAGDVDRAADALLEMRLFGAGATGAAEAAGAAEYVGDGSVAGGEAPRAGWTMWDELDSAGGVGDIADEAACSQGLSDVDDDGFLECLNAGFGETAEVGGSEGTREGTSSAALGLAASDWERAHGTERADDDDDGFLAALDAGVAPLYSAPRTLEDYVHEFQTGSSVAKVAADSAESIGSWRTMLPTSAATPTTRANPSEPITDTATANA